METKLFTENIDDAVAQGKATGADFNVIRLDVPNPFLINWVNLIISMCI